MQKLRLDLDQLVVDTFDTSERETEKGTVFGEQCTCQTACTCPGCPTCDHTHCNQHTCDQSCYGSCGTCYELTCNTCNGNTCDGARTCNPTDYYKYCCPVY